MIDDQTATQILLSQREMLSTQRDILKAQGDINERLVRVEIKVETLKSQSERQDGRMGTLEHWQVAFEQSRARMEGLIEGRAGVRKQEAALLLGFLTIASSLGGLAVAIVSKLL